MPKFQDEKFKLENPGYEERSDYKKLYLKIKKEKSDFCPNWLHSACPMI